MNTRKLFLTNRDPIGLILLDARLSSGGVPFDELPLIHGFPRKLKYQETVEIEILDFNELLYRRSIDKDLVCIHGLYRIPLAKNLEIISGAVWPTGL